MPLENPPKRSHCRRFCVGTLNDRELLVNRSKTDAYRSDPFASFGSFGSFVVLRVHLNDGTKPMTAAVGGVIARSHKSSVLPTLRALRRRLRCELRTEGLHQFDFRSGRCVYCGSKLPRAVRSTHAAAHGHAVAVLRHGGSAWLAWVVKNTCAITSRVRSALR